MTANCLQSCYQSERKCLYEYMYAFILFIFSGNKCVYMNIHLFFFSHPTCFFSCGHCFSSYKSFTILGIFKFCNEQFISRHDRSNQIVIMSFEPNKPAEKVAWFLGNTHTYGSRLWANGSKWNKCNTIHRHLCIKQ